MTNADKKRKLISIITPCYNEADNLTTCYNTVKDLFTEKLPEYDYEHIFCDNASTDETPNMLRVLASKDKNVKVILNSRNFGALPSLYNGITSSSGDAVLLFLACDLQDPPELIPDFVKKWEEGYDIVSGARDKRQENFLLANMRKIYYRVLNKISDINLPPDVGEFQLVDRQVVEALKQFDDYSPYIRGMVANCGFKTFQIKYTLKKREKGKSKTPWFTLIDIGLNGLISFSKVPLRLCLLFGFLLSIASITYGVVTLVRVLVLMLFYKEGLPPAGMSTLIIGGFLFFGIQMFFIGLLGEYVGAIHSQVRRGPLVIERERINFDSTDKESS